MFWFLYNHAVPTGVPTSTLLDLVRQRRAELEAAQPRSAISDERRIWALMALSARAEQGDPDARARMREVEKLFRKASNGSA